jgi:hypothetical protein
MKYNIQAKIAGIWYSIFFRVHHSLVSYALTQAEKRFDDLRAIPVCETVYMAK